MESTRKINGKYRRAGTGVISEGFREIGARIKASRIKLFDSNYRRAAAQIGVGEKTLLSIEQGRHLIPSDLMAMLSRELKLGNEVSRIYCGECPMGCMNKNKSGVNENECISGIILDTQGGIDSIELLEPSCQIIGQYVYETIRNLNNESRLTNFHLELIAEALSVVENLRSQLQRLQTKVLVQIQRQRPRLHLVGKQEQEKRKTACQAV